MLNRRSFSDVLPESPKSARKKEEARQAEFVRIGQVGFILKPLWPDVWLGVPSFLAFLQRISCLYTPVGAL